VLAFVDRRFVTTDDTGNVSRILELKSDRADIVTMRLQLDFSSAHGSFLQQTKWNASERLQTAFRTFPGYA
jgi:hypothetical protein